MVAVTGALKIRKRSKPERDRHQSRSRIGFGALLGITDVVGDGGLSVGRGRGNDRQNTAFPKALANTIGSRRQRAPSDAATTKASAE
jgi:hypothetical protein